MGGRKRERERERESTRDSLQALGVTFPWRKTMFTEIKTKANTRKVKTRKKMQPRVVAFMKAGILRVALVVCFGQIVGLAFSKEFIKQ